ncbi:Altered inheritance of mitochondria protein 9, mitochondrial [Mycena indigotica]|uniref:Altered inheritance of mitochondria protein 9, mitochondrial n=1 Tax=Mycena indigotica TaxID=2126181 RepID=A0A8H6S3Y6_9AGAR|nr:Altered inheritance of mitochondria protein 9, mitochondrial [Mycena indigotica]KAF7291402.1 Altered inheritance of mitochondria protein 9, mitochondrial [Mycena indigotica]
MDSALTEAEEDSLRFLVQHDPTLATIADGLRIDIEDHPSYVRGMVSLIDTVAVNMAMEQLMNRTCLGVHLFALGGFNLLFLVVFNDKTDVLVRFRMPDTCSYLVRTWKLPWQPVDSIQCEVATYSFLRRRTQIPVPEVYGWSTTGSELGAPYLVMSRIQGVPLSMEESPVFLDRIAEQLAGFENQLCENPLPQIGSLVDETGTVGPLVCEGNDRFVPDQRGPFSTSKEFILAYIEHELAVLRDEETWLKMRAVLAERNGGVGALPKAYATAWLSLLQAAILQVPDGPSPEIFRLAHVDVFEQNIILRAPDDPTIVGVIDWQGARVLPRWDERSGLNLTMLSKDLPEEEGVRLQTVYAGAQEHPDSDLPAFPWQPLFVFLESKPTWTRARRNGRDSRDMAATQPLQSRRRAATWPRHGRNDCHAPLQLAAKLASGHTNDKW